MLMLLAYLFSSSFFYPLFQALSQLQLWSFRVKAWAGIPGNAGKAPEDH